MKQAATKNESKKTNLSSIIDIIGGGTPKTTVPEYWDGNIPWLSVTDFNNDNRWVHKTEKHISKAGLNNSSTKLLQKGDIIISARGTVGALAQLTKPMTFNQSCYGLRGKSDIVDQNYLYYLLKFNVKKLLQNVHGAVFDTITRNTFDNITVPLPPLPQQRAIAAVLSSFDDKIELLRAQNRTLENIAQTIFREWFINFNFPNASGKPYKASGGHMISSELGEIPEGWKAGKIKDFGEVICGKTPSKANTAYFGGTVPFIKIPDMHGQIFIVQTEDSLTRMGAYSQRNKFISKNSICVSCIATVGLVSIASKNSQTNQQINSIIPKNENFLEYLYFSLKGMKNDLLAIGSGGSATLNINTTTFSNIDIVVPSDENLQKHHHAAKPFSQKILSNLLQIRTLTLIRDKILPQLMRGKINQFKT